MDPAPIEAALCRELTAVGVQYAEALQALRPLSESSTPASTDWEAPLQELQSRMRAVADDHGNLARLMQRWNHSGARPGARLRAVLENHRQLLSQLIQEVQSCEQRLTQDRARMRPSVGLAADRAASQAAYQRHSLQ